MRRAARVLVPTGIVCAVIGLSKIHAAWVADPAYDYTGSSRFGWSLLFGATLLVTAYGLGLPDVPRSLRGAVGTSIGAAGSGALVVSAVQLFVGDALLPRFVVLGTSLVLVPWYLLTVLLSRGGRLRAEDRDRVLVVGRDPEIDALSAELALRAERPAGLVDVMTPEAATASGGSRPLVERATTDGATVVVLDREAQADESIVAQAASLHGAGVRVRTLSLFYEQWLGKLPASELERFSLLFDIGEIHRYRYGRAKRVIDILLAAAGIVALVPVAVIVGGGNLVGNRGPLLYRQERVGKDGHRFEILKFRTMAPLAVGRLANEWTQEDDPRITSFGRVLRRFHVDELPQVINILKGDLAIVGPRPEQPHYSAELSEKLPFYDVRHMVRPGLTGWAQVKYGYAGDERDALEKLQYEFFYLRHQGFAFDMRIIGRTLRSVLGREGR